MAAKPTIERTTTNLCCSACRKAGRRSSGMATYRNVPLAIAMTRPVPTQLMSRAAHAPIAIPTGLQTAKRMTPVQTACRSQARRRLAPNAKPARPLCKPTAMKIGTRLAVLDCAPIPMPSRIECTTRAAMRAFAEARSGPPLTDTDGGKDNAGGKRSWEHMEPESKAHPWVLRQTASGQASLFAGLDPDSASNKGGLSDFRQTVLFTCSTFCDCATEASRSAKNRKMIPATMEAKGKALSALGRKSCSKSTLTLLRFWSASGKTCTSAAAIRTPPAKALQADTTPVLAPRVAKNNGNRPPAHATTSKNKPAANLNARSVVQSSIVTTRATCC
mmetsp:Transcript_131598/g.281387  ORF Transcript_131598/g.281387 Transcript_131598/m.281387 type:complete len:332 (+) Transcript_131598:219-1214(+)